MIIGTGEPNQRELKILQSIRDYCDDTLEDYRNDYWDEGYQAGLEEGRTESYEDGRQSGYNEALKEVLELITYNGFVTTPGNPKELEALCDAFHDKGPACVSFTLNYLHKCIEGWKE